MDTNKIDSIISIKKTQVGADRTNYVPYTGELIVDFNSDTLYVGKDDISGGIPIQPNSHWMDIHYGHPSSIFYTSRVLDSSGNPIYNSVNQFDVKNLSYSIDHLHEIKYENDSILVQEDQIAYSNGMIKTTSVNKLPTLQFAYDNTNIGWVVADYSSSTNYWNIHTVNSVQTIFVDASSNTISESNYFFYNSNWNTADPIDNQYSTQLVPDSNYVLQFKLNSEGNPVYVKFQHKTNSDYSGNIELGYFINDDINDPNDSFKEVIFKVADNTMATNGRIFFYSDLTSPFVGTISNISLKRIISSRSHALFVDLDTTQARENILSFRKIKITDIEDAVVPILPIITSEQFNTLVDSGLPNPDYTASTWITTNKFKNIYQPKRSMSKIGSKNSSILQLFIDDPANSDVSMVYNGNDTTNARAFMGIASSNYTFSGDPIGTTIPLNRYVFFIDVNNNTTMKKMISFYTRSYDSTKNSEYDGDLNILANGSIYIKGYNDQTNIEENSYLSFTTLLIGAVSRKLSIDTTTGSYHTGIYQRAMDLTSAIKNRTEYTSSSVVGISLNYIKNVIDATDGTSLLTTIIKNTSNLFVSNGNVTVANAFLNNGSTIGINIGTTTAITGYADIYGIKFGFIGSTSYDLNRYLTGRSTVGILFRSIISYKYAFGIYIENVYTDYTSAETKSSSMAKFISTNLIKSGKYVYGIDLNSLCVTNTDTGMVYAYNVNDISSNYAIAFCAANMKTSTISVAASPYYATQIGVKILQKPYSKTNSIAFFSENNTPIATTNVTAYESSYRGIYLANTYNYKSIYGIFITDLTSGASVTSSTHVVGMVLNNYNLFSDKTGIAIGIYLGNDTTSFKTNIVGKHSFFDINPVNYSEAQFYETNLNNFKYAIYVDDSAGICMFKTPTYFKRYISTTGIQYEVRNIKINYEDVYKEFVFFSNNNGHLLLNLMDFCYEIANNSLYYPYPPSPYEYNHYINYSNGIETYSGNNYEIGINYSNINLTKKILKNAIDNRTVIINLSNDIKNTTVGTDTFINHGAYIYKIPEGKASGQKITFTYNGLNLDVTGIKMNDESLYIENYNNESITYRSIYFSTYTDISSISINRLKYSINAFFHPLRANTENAEVVGTLNDTTRVNWCLGTANSTYWSASSVAHSLNANISTVEKYVLDTMDGKAYHISDYCSGHHIIQFSYWTNTTTGEYNSFGDDTTSYKTIQAKQQYIVPGEKYLIIAVIKNKDFKGAFCPVLGMGLYSETYAELGGINPNYTVNSGAGTMTPNTDFNTCSQSLTGNLHYNRTSYFGFADITSKNYNKNQEFGRGAWCRSLDLTSGSLSGVHGSDNGDTIGGQLNLIIDGTYHTYLAGNGKIAPSSSDISGYRIYYDVVTACPDDYFNFRYTNKKELNNRKYGRNLATSFRIIGTSDGTNACNVQFLWIGVIRIGSNPMMGNIITGSFGEVFNPENKLSMANPHTYQSIPLHKNCTQSFTWVPQLFKHDITNNFDNSNGSGQNNVEFAPDEYGLDKAALYTVINHQYKFGYVEDINKPLTFSMKKTNNILELYNDKTSVVGNYLKNKYGIQTSRGNWVWDNRL